MNIFDILIFLDPQYFRYYLYFSDLVIVLVTHTIRLGFPSLNSPAPTFLLMLSLEIDICITRRLKDLINTELKSSENADPNILSALHRDGAVLLSSSSCMPHAELLDRKGKKKQETT